MNKKLCMSLAPLVVIAAFAALPAMAMALPHWYKKGVLVGSAPIPVATSGVLTLSALSTAIKCKVNDSEQIWNPAGGGPGEDLVTAFTLSNCKSKGSAACPKGAVEVLANGLPWPSRLFSTPPPGSVIRDEIVKIRLLVRCFPGTPGDEFEGSLTPQVGKGVLIFGGPGGGTLTDGGGNPMTVSGPDTLKAPPGKITAKDP
jgi:hypothetical protein